MTDTVCLLCRAENSMRDGGCSRCGSALYARVLPARPTRLQVASNYGGAMSAMRYYLDDLSHAPAPDHPAAMFAYRKFVRWQADSIGWASRD